MRARVKNGRWVFDDPPEGLPEGTVVEIVTRPATDAVDDFHIDDSIYGYIGALLRAAGSSQVAEHGAHIARGAKRVALAAGRQYATPADVKMAAPDVMRAFATEARIREILESTPVP